MKEGLEIIRRALEKISVSGRENIELMLLCMNALDGMIAQTEKENENADD